MYEQLSKAIGTKQVKKVQTLYEMLYDLLGKDIDGDVYEFGVYKGKMAAVYSHALRGHSKTLYLYDTFKGLPEGEDGVDFKFGKGKKPYKVGTLACSMESVADKLEKVADAYGSLPSNYRMVEGDIRDTLDIKGKVLFASFDVDYYDTSKFLFDKVPPKMPRGGVIYVDDYYVWNGAKRATDEFMKGRNDFKAIVKDGLFFLRKVR